MKVSFAAKLSGMWDEATAWYERKRDGLGIEFTAKVGLRGEAIVIECLAGKRDVKLALGGVRGIIEMPNPE